MKKNCAYLLFDPLSITFSMQMLGGSENQTCSAATGALAYDPDRTLTPLVLQPSLYITDPDKVLPDGDYSSAIQSARWYLGADNTAEMILSTTDGYVLGENGELQVWRNITPERQQMLHFEGKFLDPRTESIFLLQHTLTLTTVQMQEVQLRLQTDWANPMVISALKDLGNRTLHVDVFNGTNQVDDERVHFAWKIFDKTYDTSGGYREITEEDVCYVSGQGTSSLTINRKVIDKERLRCDVYLNDYPKTILSAPCKAYRDYGQWEMSAPLFMTGKFIRPTTKTITLAEQITTPKGNLANAEKYFDIEHVYIYPDGNQKILGYGETASMDADLVRKSEVQQPTFGVNVSTRSAWRPCAIDDQLVTVNGSVLCFQQILNKY